MSTSCVASAYVNCGPATPSWLDKGDNAWQMIAATLVGLQSVPGLVILYGSYVKKKWAVNSAFMALYAFAAVLICWVLWAYKLAFGKKLIFCWGKGGFALTHEFLLSQAELPATYVPAGNLMRVTYNASEAATMYYPMATMVYFQFVFAAITVILLGGSVLGRMNHYAWVIFVPLWLTFSYTVSAFSLWGGGFLYQLGVLDYSGGYVIHVSSGTAGLTAAYWVGRRQKNDRENFPPNSILLMLAGAGMVWLGWSGFNGGDPYAANIDASLAVINTHICAATSLLVWLLLDIKRFGKPSVIGAVQGMITGLVCITPAAGLVEGWAAIIMGCLSGSIPWYTMNILHKHSDFLMQADDTMAVFHTHAVAGALGGLCVGAFANPILCDLFFPIKQIHGLVYSWKNHGGILEGIKQIGLQLAGIGFVVAWNVIVTTIICHVIRLKIPLRLSEEQLDIGDDAVHGEEAYAVWADGMSQPESERTSMIPASSMASYSDNNISSDGKSDSVMSPRTNQGPGSPEIAVR